MPTPGGISKSVWVSKVRTAATQASYIQRYVFALETKSLHVPAPTGNANSCRICPVSLCHRRHHDREGNNAMECRKVNGQALYSADHRDGAGTSRIEPELHSGCSEVSRKRFVLLYYPGRHVRCAPVTLPALTQPYQQRKYSVLTTDTNIQLTAIHPWSPHLDRIIRDQREDWLQHNWLVLRPSRMATRVKAGEQKYSNCATV